MEYTNSADPDQTALEGAVQSSSLKRQNLGQKGLE